MAAPLFDFRHLSPEERIELAEQTRDSLVREALAPDANQVAELRRRRGAVAREDDPGEPWRRPC
jgi:putative addiction module component (TIGR02574 family)